MLVNVRVIPTRFHFVLAIMIVGLAFLSSESSSAQPSCTSAAQVESLRYNDEKREITLECWRRAVNDGDLNLSGAYLRGADLKGKELSRRDLSKSDLSNADLSNAKMINTKLNAANLNQATLAHADLTNAVLTGATLNDADLANAKLNQADLTDAKLIRADLRDAELRRVKLGGSLKLTGAKVSKGTTGLDQEDLDRYQ